MPRAAAAVLVALALASTVAGVARVWPQLGDQEARYAGWSDAQIAHAPAVHERLPIPVFDAWRAALRPGDRYFVDLRRGRDRVDELRNGLVYRTFATYWLLPATPVDSPRDADVVLAYRVDPKALGIRFARVERPLPEVAVAWPAR
jgi:hypothetical protein